MPLVASFELVWKVFKKIAVTASAAAFARATLKDYGCARKGGLSPHSNEN
jgi:hypothetical protein